MKRRIGKVDACAANTRLMRNMIAAQHGNVHADAGIDDFLQFCHDVLDGAAANARIMQGWQPAGAN